MLVCALLPSLNALFKGHPQSHLKSVLVSLHSAKLPPIKSSSLGRNGGKGRELMRDLRTSGGASSNRAPVVSTPDLPPEAELDALMNASDYISKVKTEKSCSVTLCY